MSSRLDRVQEELRREIGAVLQTRVTDPRLQWVSVTRVQVAKDLSFARVYVSTLGDEEAQDAAMTALGKAAPFVRSELGHGLRLRRTPELRFVYDKGIEHSLRISEVLDELGIEDEPSDDDRGPDRRASADGDESH